MLDSSFPPCVCHPWTRGVCTHAGSGPSRARRRLLSPRLGDPHPPGQALVHFCSIVVNLNLQDLPQSQSLETRSQSALLRSISHMTILFVFTRMDEYMKSIDSGVCHKLWSILLWNRASLFTVHRISGRPPTRAKKKHFRTIWEHTFDNFPTDFNSSSLQ